MYRGGLGCDQGRGESTRIGSKPKPILAGDTGGQAER